MPTQRPQFPPMSTQSVQMQMPVMRKRMFESAAAWLHGTVVVVGVSARTVIKEQV
jgi:hypothetical protein